MRKSSNGASRMAGAPAKRKFLSGMRFLGSVAGEMTRARNSPSRRRKQVSAIVTTSKRGWTCTTPRRGERQWRCSCTRGEAALILVIRPLLLTLGILMLIGATSRAGSSADSEKAVAALDTDYQAAVKANDVATMDRILADDFVLVTGLGKTYTKADLLEQARNRRVVYEHQEDSAQKVRVWGDTAVVTALLWAKGTEDGKAFDYKLWFSDTYVRTPAGWRYVFAQASTRLPATP